MWVGMRTFRRGIRVLVFVWNDVILGMEDVHKTQRVLAIKFRNIKEDFSWLGVNVYGPNKA